MVLGVGILPTSTQPKDLANTCRQMKAILGYMYEARMLMSSLIEGPI